ncbi:RodZ domain-containing protein [Pseudidiomarina mangrovi]|uniref:RodZ domain-containing protein n=1 Tax=Pseudidiomarina mangrovi TaxID=2487133 RepID=UPI000FCBA705|nr:RodZ domain-containing protein [Pseudidiomarina mangrovi]
MSNEQNDLNSPAVEAEAVPYSGVTPGQMLREVREARGQTVAEVAAALRLRVSVVDAIEADDYEPLKGSTFVRGYFRSLAKLYDIDPKPLADAYEAMGFGGPSVSTLKMQSFSRRKIREKNDGRLMLVSYVIIAAVIGAAAWWWWQQSSFEPAPTTEMPQRSSIEAQPRDQLTEAEVAAQREAERLQQAEQLQDQQGTAEQLGAERLTGEQQAGEQLTGERQGGDQQTGDQATGDQQTGDQQANQQQTGQAQTAAQQQAAERLAAQQQTAAGDRLTMVFSQECWVKVTDASGAEIAIGVKQAGYEMPLTGSAPFDIILCKPEAVAITFNDATVDLSQYRRNRSVTLRLE